MEDLAKKVTENCQKVTYHKNYLADTTSLTAQGVKFWMKFNNPEQ